MEGWWLSAKGGRTSLRLILRANFVFLFSKFSSVLLLPALPDSPWLLLRFPPQWLCLLASCSPLCIQDIEG